MADGPSAPLDSTAVLIQRVREGDKDSLERLIQRHLAPLRRYVSGRLPQWARDLADTDIMKLNHTGTHPVHSDLAIEAAIAFHNSIGIQRKEARLRYLQTYWTSRVRSLPNVVLNTPSDPARACGIANVGIKGIAPDEVAKTLLDKYRIWTNAIDSPAIGAATLNATITSTMPISIVVGMLNSVSTSQRTFSRRMTRCSRIGIRITFSTKVIAAE